MANPKRSSKVTENVFLAIEGLHDDKLVMRHFIRYGTGQIQINQTSLRGTESSPDRLGLLSLNHDQCCQQQIGQIMPHSVLLNDQ